MSIPHLAIGVACVDAAQMTANPDALLSLTFSQAVTLLIEACDLKTAKRSAVEARIKQLQRAGMPGRYPGAPADRPHYGIPELAAFATAFQLMNAFMVPALAARYVTEKWSELASFALVGAEAALPRAYLQRRPIKSAALALFQANALADLGHKGAHGERYAGPLGDIRVVQIDHNLPDAFRNGLHLDSRDYMPVVIARFAEMTMATDAELCVELDRLRFLAENKVE